MEYKKLAERLESLVSGGEIPGVAAVAVRDGGIVFSGTAGRSRIGGIGDRPLERGDRFRIASISKLVTAIGFMKLVEEGRVSLDEDVSRYLGFTLRNPSFPDSSITPRMLLSHTSSIRDSSYYTAPMPCTMEDFFHEGGRYYEDGSHYAHEEGQEPGRYFTYANLNFGVIASIIEVISGKRFDIYMRSEIFEVLGIDASYNVRDFQGEIDRIGVLYRREKGVWKPQVDDYGGRVPETAWYTYAIGDDMREAGRPGKLPGIDEYVLGSNGTLFSPHGGLRISAEDLARIMLMLMGRGVSEGVRFMSAETVEEMERSFWEYDGRNGDTMNGFMCSYGMSIHRLRGKEMHGKLSFLRGYMGHSGEAYGLLSGMYYNPEEGRGWVYYITGAGISLEEAEGEYSVFTRWEEDIITAISADIFGEKIQ